MNWIFYRIFRFGEGLIFAWCKMFFEVILSKNFSNSKTWLGKEGWHDANIGKSRRLRWVWRTRMLRFKYYSINYRRIVIAINFYIFKVFLQDIVPLYSIAFMFSRQKLESIYLHLLYMSSAAKFNWFFITYLSIFIIIFCNIFCALFGSKASIL